MGKPSSLLFFLFIAFAMYSHGQEKKYSYTIIKTGSKYAAALVDKAFSTADMCGYYFTDKHNDIVLDDGTIVRLPSQKELSQPDNLAPGCFRPENFRFNYVVWSISDSGTIIKKYAPHPKAIKH